MGIILGRLLRPSICLAESTACKFMTTCFERIVSTHFSDNLVYLVIIHAVPRMFEPRYKSQFVSNIFEVCSDYHIVTPKWVEDEMKAIRERRELEALKI